MNKKKPNQKNIILKKYEKKQTKYKKNGFWKNLYFPEKIGFIFFIIFFLLPITLGLVRLVVGDRDDAWHLIELAMIFAFITWLNFGIVMIGQGLLTFTSYTLMSGMIAIISILTQAFTMYV